LHPDIYEALARTAQLLRMDVFRSKADRDPQIIDGLRATTVRIVSDAANLRTPAGQTLLVSLYSQLAMTGLTVDVDVANVELLVPQPPLRDDLRLVDALEDYSDDLLPEGFSRSTARSPDLTFVLGDSPFRGAAVRIGAADNCALVTYDSAADVRVSGEEPFGAIAAAAAGCAEAVRWAVPLIAEDLSIDRATLPKAWLPSVVRRIDLDLGEIARSRLTGTVDVLSGGAITNAFLYTMLRVHGSSGLRLRVVEPERLDLSNLNRYALARRRFVGELKTTMLETYSTPSVVIEGVPMRLDFSNAVSLEPWASRVIVGVDDIPSRWCIQERAATSWLAVGATSHDYVLVSEHAPDQPCAGCAHPSDEQVAGPLPTIGFVSLWAGLMLTRRLLAVRRVMETTAVQVWPLGLENARGIHAFGQAAAVDCPVQCAASRCIRGAA